MVINALLSLTDNRVPSVRRQRYRCSYGSRCLITNYVVNLSKNTTNRGNTQRLNEEYPRTAGVIHVIAPGVL